MNLIKDKMNKIISYKPFYIFIILFVGSVKTWGQASLPFTYDAGNPGTSIIGLTQSGMVADFSASPKLKFGTTGASLILNFTGTPGVLSFKIKWYQLSAALRFPGDFTLQESADGLLYTTVQLYNSTNGNPLPNASTLIESFSTLLSSTRFVKWIYTAKRNGNIGIGAINLTAGSIFTISQKTLKDFTYIFRNGNSAEQSFTVDGSNFIHDILINSPSDYEISTDTGSSFVATNPIILSQSGGIINNTIIYCRLKAGLTVNDYIENISLSSIDATTQTVSCTGNVTPVPSLTLVDISDIKLSAMVGSSNTQIINLSAVNLSLDLGLSLVGNDANQFSLSQYSVPQISGSIPNTVVTVNYSPLIEGNHAATLIITSPGAMDVSRTLTGFASMGTTTDLKSVQRMFHVSAINGNVILTAEAGESLDIYNTYGQKLIHKSMVDGVNIIPVSSKGVLLVKVNNRIAKVIL